jgi:hypothetical protein
MGTASKQEQTHAINNALKSRHTKVKQKNESQETKK